MHCAIIGVLFSDLSFGHIHCAAVDNIDFEFQECVQQEVNIKKEVYKGPSEVSNSSHEVQVSVSYKKRNIKLEQNITKTVQELKKNFCEAEKLKLSSVRLLLNGQRLKDKETIESLELSDCDVIEAFEEMSGGGKPEKPKNLVDEHEIRNALDKSFDYSV